MRRAAAAAAGAVAALLWLPAVAAAKYRGSDIFTNIAPGGADGLMGRYPISRYQLDWHVAGPSAGITSGISLGDIPGTLAQVFASWFWEAATWLMVGILTVFRAAFTLDLINGAHGALEPISRAAQHLYATTLGAPMIAAALAALGVWVVWRGLVRRQHGSAVGGVLLSLAVIVVAGAIIARPGATVGQVSRMANEASASFLAGATASSAGDPDAAMRSVTDHLFATFVFEPWVVLEFGGLRHCVSATRKDKDGFPLQARPGERSVCRDHVRQQRDGFGGYAPRWLRQAPGSDERDAEYKALDTGERPAGDPQFAGWRADKSDAIAVDVQQSGGALQRLALSALILVCTIGVVLVLGILAIGALIAQVVALGLFALTPAALVIGVLPGRGHDLFKWWAGKLLAALVVKAGYSLLLAVLVAVSVALAAAVGTIGWLVPFVLETAFFWTVYRKRHTIGGAIMHHRDSRTLERRSREASSRTVAAGAAAGGVALGATAAAVEATRDGVSRMRQEKIQRSRGEHDDVVRSTRVSDRADRHGMPERDPADREAPARTPEREPREPAPARSEPAVGARQAPAPASVGAERDPVAGPRAATPASVPAASSPIFTPQQPPEPQAARPGPRAPAESPGDAAVTRQPAQPRPMRQQPITARDEEDPDA